MCVLRLETETREITTLTAEVSLSKTHETLAAPDVLVVTLHACHRRRCMHVCVNVRQYCKVLWIKARYEGNPFPIYNGIYTIFSLRLQDGPKDRTWGRRG